MHENKLFPIYNQQISDSWAERNGLLIYENMKITDQGFTPINLDATAGITTQIDLRGNTTNKTFVVKAMCPQHNDHIKHLNPLITQGIYTKGNYYYTVQFIIMENDGVLECRMLASAGQLSYGLYADFHPTQPNQFHVFAAKYDLESTPGKINFQLYADGSLLKSYTNNYFTWIQYADNSYNNLAICQSTSTDYPPPGTVINWAMVFDSSLTAEELKAFT